MIRLLAFLILVTSASLLRAEDIEVKQEPQIPYSDSVSEDSLPDFGKIRDPFEPQLPKPKKKQTPVVVPKKKDDNKSKSKPKVDANLKQKPEPVIAPPKLVVAGIMWGDKPFAIINEKVVGVGDSIDEAKVTAISQNGVEVSFKGRTFNVRVEP
jgi:hypothetical protein